MDPTLVLFAIQAGVRLGRKVYDIFVEKNFNRALPLPLGDFVGSPLEADAQRYFFGDGWDWVKPKENDNPAGPLHDVFSPPEIEEYKPLEAYRILLGLTDVDCSWNEARHIISKMQEFEQYRAGLTEKPKLQQLLGTIVDIGIDFAKINPQAMQSGSAAQRVIGAFVTCLDKIHFESVRLPEIGGQVLKAGLEVFEESANLIIRDELLELLFHDVTKSLVEDKIFDLTKMNKEFLERIAGSALRGAMYGITADPDLFIKAESKGIELIRLTVTDVLKGLKAHKDLFTPASLENIIKNAMAAVSESAGLVTKGEFLKELIQKTLGVLSKPDQKVFTEATFAGIVEAGLKTLGNNAGSLIKTAGPQRLFLVEGLEALTEGLGTSSALTGGEFKNLLNSNQLLDLTRVVFGAAALHPEVLLGSDTPQDSYLADIIRAVTEAVREDPSKLVTGDGYLQIIKTALGVGAQNVSKIFKLPDPSQPLTSPLYQLLKGLMGSADKLVGALHSGNFPAVFEKVLRHYLLGEWPSIDDQKIIAAAKKILLTP